MRLVLFFIVGLVGLDAEETPRRLPGCIPGPILGNYMQDDEKKEENGLDPITAMSAEMEALKARIVEQDKKLDAANKNMVGMMTTNKNLLAEIQKGKSAPQPPAREDSPEEIAMKAFNTAFGIKSN